MSAISLGSTVRTEANTLSFVNVTKKTPHFLEKVQEVFKTTFEPLFGSQEKALKRIESHTDQKCELLLEGKEKPLGFIVYKKKLQDSKSYNRIENSFAVKNFYVFDSKGNENHANESMLLNRILKLANRQSAKGVHISVPKTDKDLINFFQERNFSILDSQGASPARPGNKCLMHFLLQSESSDRKRKREEPFKEPEPMESRDSKKQKLQTSTDVSQAPSSNYSQPQRDDSKNYFSSPVGPPPSQRSNSASYQNNNRDARGPFNSPQFRRTQSTSSLPPGQPKNHNIPLKKFYLQQILEGKKTVEGRINSGMMRQLRSNDEIRFFYTDRGQKVEAVCTIVNIEHFSSFREMLSHYGVNKCLAEARNLDEGVKIYDRLPGYSERAKRSGVLGIEIALKKG